MDTLEPALDDLDFAEDWALLSHSRQLMQMKSSDLLYITAKLEFTGFAGETCETWRDTKASNNRIQTFVNRCLQHILRVRWQDKVRNEDLWKRAEQQPPPASQEKEMALARPYAEKALCQCHSSMATLGLKVTEEGLKQHREDKLRLKYKRLG